MDKQVNYSKAYLMMFKSRAMAVSYDVVGHMLLLIHCGCAVIIYTNFVEVASPMLHDKLQDHRTSGSEEEDF